MPLPEKTYSILHVDDDPNVLEFSEIFLSELDKTMRFTNITSPREAPDIVGRSSFDCVLTDYQMPDIDGIQLARLIRLKSNIPIIIYTGQGSEEVAEQAFTVGIDDYIRKETHPAHYQVVAKRIAAAIERRRVEEGYRDLFNNARDAIYIHDTEGNMLDVNKAACERLGYTKEEILVLGITPFMPPEKKASFRQNISKIMDNGFTTLESSNTTRSGKTIPVEVTARRIRYRGVDAVLSFSKDISERRRLEWEMRNRLEALYYHAMHIWSLSSIEDVVECFGVIEGILGFSEGAIGFVDGDKIVFRYYGEVSSKALHTIPLGGRGITARAVRTGETQFVNDTRLDPDYLEGAKPSLSELDVPLKFGSKVIAVINIEDSKPNAFKEEDKRLVEIVGQQLAQAITRIEQEKTIQASEDDYRKLADSSLDMVALITGTKIVYVNDNAAKLLGYDHSSILIGRDISNAIAPEDRRTIAERALKRQRGEEVPTRYELRLAKRSGETLIVDATMSSINYGGTPATLIFGKNVTESRQFERNVEALHGRFMRLATANNMEELSAQVLDVITATMNCWKVCFFTLRDGELELIGEKRTTQALGCQSRDEAAKRVALFGESVNISNIRNEHADRTCLHSQIAAPVKIDGVTCAVLEAESDRVDAFKDSDLRILEMLATHVGFPLGRIYCVKVDVRAHQ